MTRHALVTGVLADSLAEHRDRCNAIVAAARRAHADFDQDVLVAQLRGPVRALVESCERALPGSAPRVLAAVFPIVTDLVAQHRLGVSGGHDALLTALPALGRHVADEPRLVVGSLANAVVHLERAGVSVERWLARVVTAAAGVDTRSLLRAGQVAAWSSGMSPARVSALDVAAELDPRALAAALGVTGPLDVDATVARLRADRWWRPAGTEASAPAEQIEPPGAPAPWQPPHGSAEPRIVARIGGFRGFGGPFLAPPVVAVRDGEVVVRSGEGTWVVHADAFGAALARTTDDGGAPSARAADRAIVPADVEPVSAARVEDLAAITVADSYRVLVVEPVR